ncbi:MAG TPA: VWA domain-containing protein, partial [Chitinophagaceae bacterium]|nr:VWA domain-containing protein [Chitinophagaceae bacterium]
IDVSGSMEDSTKLPLLKASLNYLLGLFRPTDQIAIVTYSDKATIVLPPTRANKMDTIKHVVEALQAKGKSLGGDGLEEAYNLAKQYYVTKGNNRIILATDGIFSSVDLEEKRMLKLIKKGREDDIMLSVLAFGRERSSIRERLEKMTQAGGGHLGFISSIDQGKEILLREAQAIK